MRKILLPLILFLGPAVFAEVQVLQGVTPPKKHEIPIYAIPAKLEIDDEMLPTSVDYYIFEHCAIGKEAIAIQAEQHQQPAQRGAAAKAPRPITNQHYKIRDYRTVRRCKDYVGTNTPLDRRNMMNAALRELYVPNRQTIEINMKGYLGNPHSMFIVSDKAAMPYTVPYDEMPKGSVLKKILVNPEKIAKFYSFNLPACIYLNSIIQKRIFYGKLPIRISFYEEMIGNGQARTFLVFVFNEAEKYTYQPAENETASDKVYDITPDFAVQYLK
ncbi:MAG: hypothetical protein J5594_05810 [Elusimicrobiaceae bacterium]|nr:hypothetical protein [Elusimicrobiaceae bacterium]